MKTLQEKEDAIGMRTMRALQICNELTRRNANQAPENRALTGREITAITVLMYDAAIRMRKEAR